MECFTCKYKVGRELTIEEKNKLQEEHIKKTGKRTLLIPDMEFTCSYYNKKINQTDSACVHYEGDEFMESLRREISLTAKKIRRELNS